MYQSMPGSLTCLVGGEVGDADVANLPGVAVLHELANGVLDGPLRLRTV